MPEKFNLNNFIDLIKNMIANSAIGSLFLEDYATMQYTDRNSGKTLNHAVSLEPTTGFFWLVKEKSDLFWKNFQGGSPVIVKTRDNENTGWAEITDDPKVIHAVYTQMISDSRITQKYLDNDVVDRKDSEEAQIQKLTLHHQILIVNLK